MRAEAAPSWDASEPIDSRLALVVWSREAASGRQKDWFGEVGLRMKGILLRLQRRSHRSVGAWQPAAKWRICAPNPKRRRSRVRPVGITPWEPSEKQKFNQTERNKQGRKGRTTETHVLIAEALDAYDKAKDQTAVQQRTCTRPTGVSVIFFFLKESAVEPD